jgi:hypothetical protein
VTARRIGYLVGIASAIGSGVYLLVYLYRWEWNRALIAGVFFIATEVGLGLAVVLSRLARMERRLDEAIARPVAPPTVPDPVVLQRIEEAAPAPARPFAWLDEDATRMNVFVPLLMGAGMVVSALAWAVERLARATATPRLERGLAARLGPLALPEGGFVGGPITPISDRVEALRKHLRVARARRFIAGVLVLGLTFMGFDAFMDATQDRADPHIAEGQTDLVVDIRHRNPRIMINVTEAATAYWAVCQRVLPRHLELVDIVPAGGSTARLVLQPAVGEHGLRRFRGCMEDVYFDRWISSVESAKTTT